jgi:CHAT domain-containing protein/Flp pilus assembly protein TadD
MRSHLILLAPFLLVAFLDTERALGQIETNSSPPSAQYRAIIQLIAGQNYDLAFSESKKLIERAPKFEPAYGTLIRSARASDRLSQAKIFFETLLERTPPHPGAHYGLGLIHRENKNYPLAIEEAKKSLPEMPEFNRAFNLLVDSYRDMGEKAGAETFVVSFQKSHPDSPSARYGVGYHYYVNEDYETAIGEFDAAISSSPQFADAHYYRAYAYLNSGHYAESLEAIRKCQEALEANEDKKYTKDAISLLGSIHYRLGNYTEAVKELEKALKLAQEDGDLKQQERCLGYLGVIYQDQDNYPQSLYYYKQALEVANKNPTDSYPSRHLGNIGQIYYALGDLEMATKNYRMALDIAIEVKDEDNRAVQMGNLGILYAGQNDPDRAIALYTEAMQIAKRRKNLPLQGSLLNYLAVVYQQTGNYQGAVDALRLALQLANEMPSQDLKGQSLNNLGALYLYNNDAQRALQSHQQALQTGERYRHSQIIWQARAGLASAYEKMGRLDQAREHYREAINMIEDTRAKLGVDEEKAGFFEDKVEIYKRLVGVLHGTPDKDTKQGNEAEAFRYAERARARAFLDLLAAASIDIERDLAPDLAQRRKEIENNISKINAQLLKERALEPAKQDRASIEQLERARGQADEDYANWRRELERRDPRYAALKYPEPISLEQTQKLLGERTLLLSYTLSEPSSFLFAVSRDKYLSARLESAATVRAGVEKLLTAITDKNQPSPAEYVRHAVQLYKLLIEPARELLIGKSELIIVADDALHRLPFEVLLAPTASARTPLSRLPYLVRDFAISYAPSASALEKLLSEPRKATLKEFVAFADPVYPQDAQPSERAKLLAKLTRGVGGGQVTFPPLLHSLREAKGISKLFPSGQADLFLRAAASEENAKAKDRLSQYGVVHFSAHGYLNENRPRFSGIVLSLPQTSLAGQAASIEDGLLSAYEIFNLKLNAELVVLSACETGLGKEVKGEGMIGLMRAFMYAGTPSIVVSLWNVDDESAADLMIGFYRHWRGADKGALSKAEALRRAQLDAIKQSSLPYYWAPFILVGKS